MGMRDMNHGMVLETNEKTMRASNVPTRKSQQDLSVSARSDSPQRLERFESIHVRAQDIDTLSVWELSPPAAHKQVFFKINELALLDALCRLHEDLTKARRTAAW